MLLSEFIEKTGLYVTTEEFNVFNAIYLSSDNFVNNTEFCQWVKMMVKNIKMGAGREVSWDDIMKVFEIIAGLAI